MMSEHKTEEGDLRYLADQYSSGQWQLAAYPASPPKAGEVVLHSVE